MKRWSVSNPFCLLLYRSLAASTCAALVLGGILFSEGVGWGVQWGKGEKRSSKNFILVKEVYSFETTFFMLTFQYE